MVERELKQASQQVRNLVKADIKIILLGDSAVGKSKLVQRFLLNDYIERQLSTYALTMYRHRYNLQGRILEIDIWDTAGQECFDSLHPSYYHGAHACILVFDVTRKITYQNLRKWYQEMRSFCPHIPCVLLANKIDMNLEVTNRQFKFGEAHGLDFYFVSAADGTNVVRIFQETVNKALEYQRNPPSSFERDLMELLEDDSWFTSVQVKPDHKNILWYTTYYKCAHDKFLDLSTLTCVDSCSQGTFQTNTFYPQYEQSHPDCQNYTGPNQDDCFCIDPNSVLVQETCECQVQNTQTIEGTCECNNGYYKDYSEYQQDTYICRECHPNCATCNGGDFDNCQSWANFKK